MVCKGLYTHSVGQCNTTLGLFNNEIALFFEILCASKPITSSQYTKKSWMSTGIQKGIFLLLVFLLMIRSFNLYY